MAAAGAHLSELRGHGHFPLSLAMPLELYRPQCRHLSAFSPLPLIVVLVGAETIYGAGPRNVCKPPFLSTQGLRMPATKVPLS